MRSGVYGNKGKWTLTREQKANLIEDWVNNPDISLYVLGDKYRIKPPQVSNLISKIWFYKREGFTTQVAVRQSRINEEQLRLKLSA